MGGCPAPPPAPPETPDPTTPHLALAVWPPANPNLPDDYLSTSHGKHRIPPELAARAVLAYTDPGDLVLDPDCATGSVLVEAIRHGRRAIGLTTNPAHGALAIANTSHAREQGAPGRAAILEGSTKQLPRLLRKAPAIIDADARRGTAHHPAGSVRLILTAPAAPALPEQLTSLRAALAPGGFLLLALDHQHSDTSVGLGPIVDTAERAGLHYWQHVIALRITAAAEATVLLHTDVLAFRKPTVVAARRVASRAVSA